MISTTRKQTQMLLDAGVPRESADMMWRNATFTYDFGTPLEVSTKEPVLYAFNTRSEDSTPAWSMSALWDLLHSANLPYEYCTTKDSAYVMDSLVEAVCRASRQKKIPSDFNANIIPTNEADLPDGK